VAAQVVVFCCRSRSEQGQSSGSVACSMQAAANWRRISSELGARRAAPKDVRPPSPLLVLKEQLSHSSAPVASEPNVLAASSASCRASSGRFAASSATDQVIGDIGRFRAPVASLTQTGNGLPRPVQLEQYHAQVVERICLKRIEGYGPFEFPDPVLQPLIAQAGHRQVVVPLERVGSQSFDDLPKPLGGSGSIARLKVEQAKAQIGLCQSGSARTARSSSTLASSNFPASKAR